MGTTETGPATRQMTASKHIFISYRRDGAVNQRWAERIDERLVAEGFSVWRDVTGIQPGQRWGQVIPPALDDAAMVLCVVSKSVLESEWVLRSVYKLPRERIAAFFRLLLQSENAVVEDHGVVERALEWYEQGDDCADALHLAACDGAEMQTFDERFCKQARASGQAVDR